jgi:hypothetical protein
MKESKIFIFQHGESVDDSLRNIGLEELSHLPFKTQVADNKWHDIGSGKLTMIFYCIKTPAETVEHDEFTLVNISIEAAYVVVRYPKKENESEN